MDSLLADYKLYYRTRMEIFQDNPMYPNAYMAEKALFDAMNSCNELIEFKEKLGDLNVKNAIALIKDKETARHSLYNSYQEDIRANGPNLIVQDIDQATDVNEAISISNNHDQKGLIDISVDGFIDHVWGKLIPALERIDVSRNAEYPAKYESLRNADVVSQEVQLREEIQSIDKQLKDWRPEGRFDVNLVWEHRHRKKVPIPDAILESRLNELKNYM